MNKAVFALSDSLNMCVEVMKTAGDSRLHVQASSTGIRDRVGPFTINARAVVVSSVVDEDLDDIAILLHVAGDLFVYAEASNDLVTVCAVDAALLDGVTCRFLFEMSDIQTTVDAYDLVRAGVVMRYEASILSRSTAEWTEVAA